MTFNKADPDPLTETPDSLTTYVIGDDVIAQTKDGTTQYLLYDGHGSTRQLAEYDTDVTIVDSFSYDGYGVLLQDNAVASSNPGKVGTQATNLLYAGEQFDVDAQSYYLRARYYNPSNGLFNRVDPFSGNNRDPQSLHKYNYTYSNPINAIDPTGNFEFSLTGLVQSMAINSLIMNIGMPIIQPAGRFIAKGFLGKSWANFFNSDSWQHGASIFGFSGAKPVHSALSITGAFEALIGWNTGDFAIYAAAGISTPRSYTLNAYIGCVFNVKNSSNYNWHFFSMTFSLKMLPTKWQEKVMNLIAIAATKTTSPSVQQAISQVADKSISVMPLVNRILGNKTLNITLFGSPMDTKPYGFNIGIGKAYGGTAKSSISVGWQLYHQIYPWREVDFQRYRPQKTIISKRKKYLKKDTMTV